MAQRASRTCLHGTEMYSAEMACAFGGVVSKIPQVHKSQGIMYHSSAIKSFRRSSYVIITQTWLWLAVRVYGCNSAQGAKQSTSTHLETNER
jgi:hypothetical protein